MHPYSKPSQKNQFFMTETECFSEIKEMPTQENNTTIKNKNFKSSPNKLQPLNETHLRPQLMIDTPMSSVGTVQDSRFMVNKNQAHLGTFDV
jgi:hypothetical protein